jgi:hypothetical protein
MKNPDRINMCKILNLVNIFPGRIRALVEEKAADKAPSTRLTRVTHRCHTSRWNGTFAIHICY